MSGEFGFTPERPSLLLISGVVLVMPMIASLKFSKRFSGYTGFLALDDA